MPPPPNASTSTSTSTGTTTTTPTWQKAPAWQGCPPTQPTMPPAPPLPNSAPQNTLLHPVHAQGQVASTWLVQPSAYATRQSQEQWAARMHLGHSDARSDGPQSKHAVSANHYTDISNSPFIQLGSKNQNATFSSSASHHSNPSHSQFDRIYYPPYLTASEVTNNVLEKCRNFSFQMPMPQYPKDIEMLCSADYPFRNLPPPAPLLLGKQYQDNQSTSQVNNVNQTSSIVKEHNIDLPLPEKVSYHDAKQHFIRLKKLMDIFYQETSKTETYQAKNKTTAGENLQKGTDYLHYLFLDTYLNLVGHEEHLKQQEAQKLLEPNNDSKKLELTAEDREIFKTLRPLDAAEMICRFGHIDDKNYSLMIANALEKKQAPESEKSNTVKMDLLPRFDSYNIHALTPHQCAMIKNLRPRKRP